MLEITPSIELAGKSTLVSFGLSDGLAIPDWESENRYYASISVQSIETVEPDSEATST